MEPPRFVIKATHNNTGPCPIETPAARRRRQEITQRKAKEENIGDKRLHGYVLKEQQQHAVYEIKVSHTGKRRAQNTTENNLDVYLRRGNLDGKKSTDSMPPREARLIEQENKMTAISRHAAALNLYRDFYASRMVGGLKSCLNITIGRGNGNKAGMNFAAYTAYLSAVQSIRKKRHQKLIVNVCCIGEWLKDCNNLSIAPHKRMDIFLKALDTLVNHYERKINASRVMASFNASLTTTMGTP